VVATKDHEALMVVVALQIVRVLLDLVVEEVISIMDLLMAALEEQHLNQVKQTFQEQQIMEILEEMVLQVQQ
jgi:hypothetical protein